MAAAAIAISTGTPATAKQMQRVQGLGGCNGRRFQQHWCIQVRALTTWGHGRLVPHLAEPRRSRVGAASESSRPAGDQDAACPSQPDGPPSGRSRWPSCPRTRPRGPGPEPSGSAHDLGGVSVGSAVWWPASRPPTVTAPPAPRVGPRTAAFALAADSDRPERIMPTLQPLPGPARADSDF